AVCYLELRDRHRVHAGCALARPDFLPRLPDSVHRDSKRLARCFQLIHSIPPGALPADQTDQATNDPAPSLRPPYRDFTATANRSASPSRDGTQPLAVQPPGVLPIGRPRKPGPASVRTRLLLFRAEAADRARVACMPDTTWPVSGYPPGSSRGRRNTPVSMSSQGFGTSATIRSRSPSRSPPDGLTGAFSSSLTTTVFSQRSMRRLGASLRRAAPKGHETFISRTAPHQEPVPTSGPPCVQDTLRHPQVMVPSEPAKNTRSPGRGWEAGMRGPEAHC